MITAQEIDDKYSLEAYTGNLATTDIIDFFVDKVGKDNLLCVEKLGQTSTRTYLKKGTDMSQFLTGYFTVQDVDLYFLPVGEKLKTVFVKGLPFSVTDKLIIDVLLKYGRMRSIGYERHQGSKPVCTGTRVVKIKLDDKLPSFLRFGKFTAVISYKGQKKECRRCGSTAHIAQSCNTKREDFKEGFPVHTRPVAPKGDKVTHSALPNGSIETPAVFRELVSILNSAVQSAGATTSTSAGLSSLAQRLTEFRMRTNTQSSHANASHKPSVESATAKAKEDTVRKTKAAAAATARATAAATARATAASKTTVAAITNTATNTAVAATATSTAPATTKTTAATTTKPSMAMTTEVAIPSLGATGGIDNSVPNAENDGNGTNSKKKRKRRKKKNNN